MQLCALFERVMLKQMPLSAAALLPIIALTGDVTGGAPPLSSVTLTPQQLGMIALTAVMSFFVNSTTYIIAELSPIRLPWRTKCECYKSRQKSLKRSRQ